MGLASRARSAPVAIVGIGCRFPGDIQGPAALWDALCNGLDAIRPIPQTRWNSNRYYHSRPNHPGTMNANRGGFIDKIDEFDARFFGISPREASRIDPQQRLLLEVSWEALENAGIAPEERRASRTGVFMGACNHDYYGLQTSLTDLDAIDAHTATGGSNSIVANRLSYFYDFRGPSVSIDTACSSSLVATHLACSSLEAGECDVALAGGVNLILTPPFMISLSQASMLSPDGRCRAFDAEANGYVRAEGIGVVVLKTLERAVADGDRIYAVIASTVVNQDGRTPGITMPNGEAQEAAVMEALEKAGVSASAIAYVEAHGTGTPVGDPIEANALGRALSRERQVDRPCFIGSIKTNIGHCEAAAGIAGLIKAALAVHHRRIPPNRNFTTPNPKIGFEELKLQVPTSLQPWPQGYEYAMAGVNSFGFGGTNAHALVREPPRAQEPRSAARPSSPAPAPEQPELLVFSARSEESLRELARSYQAYLQNGESTPALTEIAASLSRQRTHHPEHRLALVATSKARAAELLATYAENKPAKQLFVGSGGKKRPLVFAYHGQGPQWWAMGRKLMESNAVFRRTLEQCDALMRRHADWSLLEELRKTEAESRVQQTQILQPAMFAIQVGLTEVWKSWGVVPDAVIGHSMGEIAAVHVAGILSLEDAIRVICQRARIQAKANPEGGMLFVGLPSERSRALCLEHPDQVWLAADNSPGSSTLAGDRRALEAIHRKLEAEDVFSRLLQVNCACHTPHMEPLRAELMEVLAGVTPNPESIPIYSTVLGEEVPGLMFGPDYWWWNFRQAVNFRQAIDHLLQAGYETFLEVGVHPALQRIIQENAQGRVKEPVVLPSLHRSEDDRAGMLSSLGALYARGAEPQWSGVHVSPRGVFDLPNYAWHKQRYWHESAASQEARIGQSKHPILDRRLDLPAPTWEIRWGADRLRWIEAHDVLGAIIVPAVAFLEAALVATKEAVGEPCALEHVEIERALVVTKDTTATGRITVSPEERTFTVHNREGDDKPWGRNVRGRFYPAPLSEAGGGSHLDIEAIKARCGRRLDVVADPQQEKETFFEVLRRSGYAYGSTFRGMRELFLGDGEALAYVEVPSAIAESSRDYMLHPGVWDSCLQIILAFLFRDSVREGRLQRAYLPSIIRQIRVHRAPTAPLWTYARQRELTPDRMVIDLVMMDQQGRPLVEIKGLEGKGLQPTEETARAQPQRPLDEDVYRYEWIGKDSAHTSAFEELTNLSSIEEEIAPYAQALEPTLRRAQHYRDVVPALDRLCADYLYAAFQRLGWALSPGARIEKGRYPGVSARYTRAVEQYLKFLATLGWVRADAGGWVVGEIAPRDPARAWQALGAQQPAYHAELWLLSRCGERLHDVLAGRQDPLELIYPAGSQTLTEQIFRDSPTCRVYNLLAKRAIETLLRSVPAGRKLRILEIGGGTGGVTAYLLPILERCCGEYVFTDISSALLGKARQDFTDYSFVTYKALDLEQDLAGQGFAAGTFDLVLACDVVHATRDVRESLGKMHQLLRPNGLAMLIEVAPPSAWLDLTYGLTDGWWRFTDTALRPSHPLLPHDAWVSVFEQAGFEETAVLAETQRVEDSAQVVLLARRGASSAAARPEAARPRHNPAGTWLLVMDKSGVGEELTRKIEAAGGRALRAQASADYQRVLRAAVAASDGSLSQVVYLPSLDRELEAGGLPAPSLRDTSMDLLKLVRAISEVGANKVEGLFLVTRGAQAVLEGESPSLLTAPLWSLGLVVRNEVPTVPFRLVDLDPVARTQEANALWSVLTDPDDEADLALRANKRLTRRLIRVAGEELDSRRQLASDLSPSQAFQVGSKQPGTLEQLCLQVVHRVPPRPGEVEIEVRSGSLNFRDLMIALRMIPGQLDETGLYGLGDELAGVITAVGPGVEDLRVGDEVIAVSGDKGGFRSHLTISRRKLVRKPKHLSFDEAAAIPIAFLTAWYGLHKRAQLSKGERVLIHSASGGLGLAAIQVARLLGAEVFATAGSPVKRDYLHSLGVEHVMDSRTLDFADELLRRTGGRGVDVVLNSLAGDAAARGLACLAPYGRFIEVGKRDFLANASLGLKPFLQNLSYFAFDLRQTLLDRPEEALGELEKLLKFFEAGTLAPVPYRTFPVAHARSAYRNMSQARHIGKLALSFEDRRFWVSSRRGASLASSAQDTWLITGGLGGFGLAAARWLVSSGVRNLILVGRRGASSPEALRAVEELKKAGASVAVYACDASNREQLSTVLEDAKQRGLRLHGVIHAAMVLDDAPLESLDAQRFQRVLEPKVAAAWNLHQLTQDLPLQHFILFSSATSVLGLSGQANYAVANSFLDALAQYRRARGLPGLAVNWGALSETGYVARNPEVLRLLEARGVRSFSPDEATALLGRLLHGEAAQVSVMRVDWAQWINRGGERVDHLKYEQLVATRASAGSAEQAGRQTSRMNLRTQLKDSSDSERMALLEQNIREQIAHILGLGASEVPTDKALTEIGLDSLLAGELSQWSQREAGADISVMQLMRGPSIKQLAELMVQRMGGAAAPRVEAAEAPARPAAPSAGRWLHCVQERPQARARLICIPYLGGGAAVYHRWGAAAPGWLEVYAVELPGRGERAAEQPMDDLRKLVDEMAKALAPLMDKPFAVYGHSLGGIMAYELVRTLRERHGAEPLHLFIGAAAAPDDATLFAPIKSVDAQTLETAPLRAIRERLRERTGDEFPEFDLGSGESTQEAQQMIRADLLLAQRYSHDSAAELLSSAITTFIAPEDPRVPRSASEGWSRHTTGRFQRHVVEGDHLFIRQNWREVVNHICAALEPALP